MGARINLTTAFALLAGLVATPILAAPVADASTVTVTKIETYTLLIETILIEPTTITVSDCGPAVTTTVVVPPVSQPHAGPGSSAAPSSGNPTSAAPPPVSSAKSEPSHGPTGIPSVVSSMGGGLPSAHPSSGVESVHSMSSGSAVPTGSHSGSAVPTVPISGSAAPTGSHSGSAAPTGSPSGSAVPTGSHSGSAVPTGSASGSAVSTASGSHSASGSVVSNSASMSMSASASASASSSAPSGCPSATLKGQQDSFALNTTLPGLPFEIPQSYAGYISVNETDPTDARQLYFWHTPVDAEGSDDDIIIWFNGGPGCSSMEGLFQENGPFQLPYYNVNETVQPRLNPYSNHKAAHSIWIDSPGLTGFSKAGHDVSGLKAVAKDIAGFLVNFFEAFPNLRDKRLWLQGESFAGAMIPYMADRIYSDTSLKCKGINLKGVQINDPSWANDYYMQSLPIYPYAVKNQELLTITDEQLAAFKEKAAPYGLDTYYQDNLVYPPKGPLPFPANWNSSVYDIYSDIVGTWNGAHCSSVYDISTQCPYTIDPLGYPQAAVSPSYDNFLNNQTGFLEAIHADKVFLECDDSGFTSIGEPSPNESVMPYVIEQSEHVVIGGGDNDILLLTMGSELVIQNMTWNGLQGFQKGLRTDLVTSEGVRGNYITERNLSMIEFYYAGHMIPQDDGEAAFRATQYLIGTIDKL